MRKRAPEALWPAPATSWLRIGSSLLAGVAFLIGYVAFERGLVRGPAEFVYWPPLEPLPFAPMRGFTYEQLARHVGRLLLVGPGLLLLSFAVSRCVVWRAPEASGARRWALVTGGLSLVAVSWLMASVLEGRALVDDELTYTVQAELLAEGRLAEDRLPPWAPEPFTIWTRLGATGKYLFGEPLIQLPGTLLGLPGLMHLPLLAFTLGLWFQIVRRGCGGGEAGAEVASWATVLLAASPMVVLTTATGMSHASSLFAMVALGWGLSLAQRDRPVAGGLVGGAALGLGMAVRVQVAVPFGGVLVGALALVLWRKRQWLGLVALSLSGGVWALAIGLYNRALTGSFTTLPWSFYRPREGYGFGAVLEGSDYLHTVPAALENLAVVAVRMNGFLLGWPLSLAILALWWVTGKRTQGAAPWLWAGVALVAFNLGYYSPGVSDTGPIYHYELVLPLSILGAHALVVAFGRWPRLTSAALVVHLTLGTVPFLLEQASRLDRFVTMVHGPIEELLEPIERPSLLLWEDSPKESVRLGWLVGGFPIRERSDRDLIVTFPRSGPETSRALREAYSTRQCWYYRVEPKTLRPMLERCEVVESLLARPAQLEGPFLALRSTAMRKGLVPLN